MAWMSNLIASLLGRSSLEDRIESVVAKAEPSVWQTIDGRVPLGSVNEVRGYVWAAAATAVRNAACDGAQGLNTEQVQHIVQQARMAIAMKIASQLEMYAADQPCLRRAA